MLYAHVIWSNVAGPQRDMVAVCEVTAPPTQISHHPTQISYMDIHCSISGKTRPAIVLGSSTGAYICMLNACIIWSNAAGPQRDMVAVCEVPATPTEISHQPTQIRYMDIHCSISGKTRPAIVTGISPGAYICMLNA